MSSRPAWATWQDLAQNQRSRMRWKAPACGRPCLPCQALCDTGQSSMPGAGTGRYNQEEPLPGHGEGGQGASAGVLGSTLRSPSALGRASCLREAWEGFLEAAALGGEGRSCREASGEAAWWPKAGPVWLGRGGVPGTHDLRVGDHPAAVGGGERGGTGLTVPGHAALLGGAAHG